MAERVYPALDTVGFIKNPTTIADRLLADYIGTNYSQSNVFHGKLKSLSYATKNNTNDMVGLCDQMTRDLTELFSRWLNNVAVEVTAHPTETHIGTPNESLVDIHIAIQYSANGVMQELSKSIRYDNTATTRIAKLESR